MWFFNSVPQKWKQKLTSNVIFAVLLPYSKGAFRSMRLCSMNNVLVVRFLETFAPTLPIQALLLTAIRKLVGGMLVRASDEEQAVQSKTPQENHAYCTNMK